MSSPRDRHGARSAGSWLLVPHAVQSPRLRLFCFPYAGGGPAVYRAWPRALPPDVELCAVHLPGRGARFTEPPFSRLEPLIEALAAALAPRLDVPFAFFGHSMGALVAFELTRLLRRRGQPQPVHLFASGREAPQVPDPKPPTHALPDMELLAEVRRAGGTPQEVLDQPELMELMLPLLRADFAVIETWKHAPEPPLEIPLTAFGGLADVEVPRAHTEAWREQTRGPFAAHLLPGDHFFAFQGASSDAVQRTVALSLARHADSIKQSR